MSLELGDITNLSKSAYTLRITSTGGLWTLFIDKFGGLEKADTEPIIVLKKVPTAPLTSFSLHSHR